MHRRYAFFSVADRVVKQDDEGACARWAVGSTEAGCFLRAELGRWTAIRARGRCHSGRFQEAEHRRSWLAGEPMAGIAVVCGSGRNGELRWRIMEGEDLVDVVHVAFAADRAEAGVDALLGEVGVKIGNVGLLWIGEAEQLPTAD